MPNNGEQMLVPIDDVIQSDSQLREVDKEGEHYKMILESLALPSGLINPISVRRQVNKETNQEELILVDGAHRLTACREAGFPEIAVNILDVNELQALAAQIIANTAKEDQKAYQLGKHYRRMISIDPSLTVSDLAKLSCKSEGFINQRMGLDRLLPIVGQAVDEGKIQITSALALAALPLDMQKEWADQAITAANQTEFIEAVKTAHSQRRQAEKEGRDPSDVKFVPEARMRKLPEVRDELANGMIRDSLIVPGMSLEDAWNSAISWVLSLDAATVKAREDKYNAAQQATIERRNDQVKKANEAKVARKEAEAKKLRDALEAGEPLPAARPRKKVVEEAGEPLAAAVE